MENRVQEFRTLVDHLRPEIAVSLSGYDGMLGSDRFRRAIAPVYLRRNQVDVLNELPPRLETDEWVTLTGKDSLAYRDAVYEGNFMKMRRAAFAAGTPNDSAKLRRLLEITDEAPAIEDQAIARAHRMGQVRRVDVHRLLAEDSVDQRILEVLGVKRAEFDAYARRSDLKEITPDAVDISDLAAAKEVAAQVESERHIIDLERSRLRLEEEDKSTR
jgi:hypothetical protein